VVANIIRLVHHQLREEQVDTAKEGLRLGSLEVKSKPGANLGVLDSTRALGLTTGQTRVLGSTKDQTRALGLTKDQTRVLVSTKDQTRVLGSTKDLFSTKDQTKDPGSTKDQTQDSAVEVPNMEIMTILHLLDVALWVVVVVVQTTQMVVGRKSKALEASSQEKVVMEERSAMCSRFLSKAANIDSYAYS